MTEELTLEQRVARLEQLSSTTWLVMASIIKGLTGMTLEQIVDEAQKRSETNAT